jgi:hypothetical protein
MTTRSIRPTPYFFDLLDGDAGLEARLQDHRLTEKQIVFGSLL